MDEFDEFGPKGKLFSMIESKGMHAMLCPELDSMIAIDACQNPHEIWDDGLSNWVNVCIPMPVETALEYKKKKKKFGFPTDYQDSIKEYYRDIFHRPYWKRWN